MLRFSETHSPPSGPSVSPGVRSLDPGENIQVFKIMYYSSMMFILHCVALSEPSIDETKPQAVKRMCRLQSMWPVRGLRVRESRLTSPISCAGKMPFAVRKLEPGGIIECYDVAEEIWWLQSDKPAAGKQASPKAKIWLQIP